MVVEGMWVAVLSHPVEYGVQSVHVLLQGLERRNNCLCIIVACILDSIEHKLNCWSSFCLDGHGHEVEPRLVEGAVESCKSGKVAKVDALVPNQDLPIPQANSGVGRNRCDVKVLGDLEIWYRD